MATLTNILLFIFVFSTIFFLGFSIDAPNIRNTPIANNTYNQIQTMQNSTQRLIDSVNTKFTIPSIGTITFPNVFGIFVETFNILSSLVMAPIALFAGLAGIGIPSILSYIFSTLLMLVAIIAILNWYKGVGS